MGPPAAAKNSFRHLFPVPDMIFSPFPSYRPV